MVATISKKLLAMRPQRVFFVGHYNGEEGIDDEIEKSELLAKQLSDYIMSTVTGLRLDSYGVGSLSSTHPDSGNMFQWVEIFIEN